MPNFGENFRIKENKNSLILLRFCLLDLCATFGQLDGLRVNFEIPAVEHEINVKNTDNRLPMKSTLCAILEVDKRKFFMKENFNRD